MSSDHTNPYAPPQEAKAEFTASQISTSDGRISGLRVALVIACGGPIGLCALGWVFMLAFPTGMAITAWVLGRQDARSKFVYVCGSIFAWIATLLALYGMIRLATYLVIYREQTPSSQRISRNYGSRRN